MAEKQKTAQTTAIPSKQPGSWWQKLKIERHWTPARVILVFFIGLIALGTLLLWLPLSTASGQATTLLTAFFTATSAACVTGLVVVDTGSYWSTFGHIVIALLVQVGGLGFASSSVFFLVIGRRPNLNDRMALQSAIGLNNPKGAVALGLLIIKMTLILEVTGAILLFIGWVGQHGTGKAAAWAVFHSITAFANAGFDLAGTAERPFVSLVDYSSNYIVNFTISFLIILGGIGFVVIAELLQYRRNHRLTVHTKIVLIGSFALLVFGTLFIWLAERTNPQTLGTMSLPEQLTAAFFQSASPRTAGYNTINLTSIYTPTFLLILLLMFIGGGSGSTAGGLKVGTLTVILASLRSTVLERPNTLFKRTIPARVIDLAMAIGTFYVLGIMIFTILIAIFDNIALQWIVFEVVSALCTVGLSLGATPNLSTISQLLLCLAMFLGRLGPILLIVAFSRQHHSHSLVKYPEEDIAIG